MENEGVYVIECAN